MNSLRYENCFVLVLTVVLILINPQLNCIFAFNIQMRKVYADLCINYVPLVFKHIRVSPLLIQKDAYIYAILQQKRLNLTNECSTYLHM